MQKLSDKQKLVLRKLKSHIAANGFAPTNRELAKMVGLQSVSTVHGHLQRLAASGYIEIVGVRAIKILDKEVDLVESPSGSDQARTIEAAHG